MESAAVATVMEAVETATTMEAESPTSSLATIRMMSTLRNTSICYYLGFVPAFPLWTGPRPINFTKEDDRDSYETQIMRCIEVALGKLKEKLQLVGIVRANYSFGYGFVYWITMDVKNKNTGEIKTCICKVHHGIKAGDEDDMIVLNISSLSLQTLNIHLQGAFLNEQDSSLLDPA